MDLSALMKLAQNPQVRQLVTSLVGQMRGNSGGASMKGLMDNMTAAGMGDQVSSWIGTGAKQPMTSQQVTEAFGQDHINQAAKDAGCSPQEAADTLSKALPQVVDTATPGGQPPKPGEFDAMFAQLFGGTSEPPNKTR